jgi:phosphoribosyl 1,2-cyclic phosphodiesterase
MVEVCAIASGSNGNCYYVGNENDAILVDAGISCKQILLRMEQKALSPQKLRAVFISHEHADHVRGARVLSKKLSIPVYYTYGTWNKAHKSSKSPFYAFIHIGTPLRLGDFKIHAFSKKHDAKEPCSYRVEIGGFSIGVMTDIGSVCEKVSENFSLCDVVFLESNYDHDMLMNGPYHWVLKQRIVSEVGHLSNIQAVELVKKCANGKLKAIFLSHLSGENNTPDLAFDAFKEFHQKYNVIKTSRSEASEVLSL